MSVKNNRADDKHYHHFQAHTVSFPADQRTAGRSTRLNHLIFKLNPGSLIRLLPVSMFILAAFWHISGIYSSSFYLRGVMLFCLIVETACLYWRWRNKRQFYQEGEHLRVYVEHVLTNLNAGHSLESSLIEVVSQLEHSSQSRSPFQSMTARIAHYLRTGHTLRKTLEMIRPELKHPDVLIFFSCLIFISQTGTRLTHFIEQQHRAIVERNTLIDQAESIQSQKKTEAGLLCFMPLLLAYLILYQGLDHIILFDHIAGRTGAMISFLLTAAATLITGLILTADYQKTGFQKQVSFMKTSRLFDNSGQILRCLYETCLPSAYTAKLFDRIRLYKQFQQTVLSGKDDCHAGKSVFFKCKSCLVIYSLPAAVIACFTGIGVKSLMLPLIICLLHDLQLTQWAKKFSAACQQEYPAFINLISVLLQAGCSLHRALSICADTYCQMYADEKKHSCAVLQSELKLIRDRLEMSWSGKMIMAEQASRCHLSAAKAAFHLFARFEETGNVQVLHLIGLQASSCWQMKQNALRTKLQEQSFYLIVPMMLNLLSVMIIAVLPSIMIFLQSNN